MEMYGLFEGEEIDMENVLPKYNYGTGAGWCSVRERKKIRGHQTPGRTKVLTCQTNAFKNHMARCSRSYKDNRYGSWMDKTRI